MSPARPWCFKCRSWAEELGVACDYHWFVLSDEAKAGIAAEVRRLHPRGGRVERVTEQAWVTRLAAGPARTEWAIRDDFEAIEDAGGDPGEWPAFRAAALPAPGAPEAGGTG